MTAWQWVPVKATRAMTIEAEKMGAGEAWAEDCYTAMIAVVPAPDVAVVERVARAMWQARMEIHDNWPSERPFDEQSEMIRTWVITEARAALNAMSEAGDG